MTYDVEKEVEKVVKSVNKLTESIEDGSHKLEGNCMMNMSNDIAGLLALMQNNRNLDFPGLLALCKDRGYDRSFGGEGMFMFVFLILFLFAGGGWNNLTGRQQNDFRECAGNSFQMVMDLADRISHVKDRIADGQAVNAQNFQQLTASTNMGFNTLDTKLCTAIAEVLASVRDQGDRSVAMTQSVKDQLFQCCCDIKGKIDFVINRIEQLYGHVSLMQERTVNKINEVACDLGGQIQAVKNDVNLGFERQARLISDTAKDQEMARLQREVAALKEAAVGKQIADQAVTQLANLILTRAPATAAQNGAVLGPVINNQ